MNTTRDSPSFSFKVDPYLEEIYDKEQFGIVLVAAWPPTNQIFLDSYETFVSQVKRCFDAKDYLHQQHSTAASMSAGTVGTSGAASDVQMTPNVYIYPSQHLHITIATFHPFHKQFLPSPEMKSNTAILQQEDFYFNDNESYSKICTLIVQKSMERNDWPKEKINLEIDRTQIGEKAGIILWKGRTGKDQELFYNMRSIIREEYDRVMEKYHISEGDNDLQHRDRITRELQIPNIIHSTFLRFGGHPVTDGKLIQRRFQSMVQSKVKEIFGNGHCINTVKLVTEKRAYMHVPCDEDHILKSMDML